MAMTGWEPVKIRKSIINVIEAYEDLQDALISVTQQQFVTPMATLWCCKESVDFFKDKFKPAIESLNDGASKTFKDIVELMNRAAQEWAKRTGNTGDWRQISFTPKVKKIAIDAIKDRNAEGEIGIDEVQAVVKAGLLLTKTFVKAQAALTKASAAVHLCGFLGGQQESALQRTLKTISSKIETTTKELATTAKKAIENSASEYHKLAEGLSSSFQNLGGIIGSVATGAAAAEASANASYKPEVSEKIEEYQQRINEIKESGYGNTRHGMGELGAYESALQEMKETGEVVEATFLGRKL